MVLSNEKYNENEYIRNYEDFMTKASRSKAGISGAFGGHKGGKIFHR